MGYSLFTVIMKDFLLNNDCLTKQIIKQPQAKLITGNFLETSKQFFVRGLKSDSLTNYFCV